MTISSSRAEIENSLQQNDPSTIAPMQCSGVFIPIDVADVGQVILHLDQAFRRITTTHVTEALFPELHFGLLKT